MTPQSPRTSDLLDQAGQSDPAALSRLLERHRDRLKRLVAARFDARLSARVDPSDIVQETLVDAGRRLPEYLRNRQVPYWVWLRRLALQRLTWWRRFHIGSLKRSVTRETAAVAAPASSQPRCVDGLVDSSISPSGRAVGNEEQLRARLALESLDASDREILHLRYLEDLSFAEIASRLGLGLSAVKMRHVRALERFRTVLNPPDAASQP